MALKKVPTGSLYGKGTRQIGRQTTDTAHVMLGVLLVPVGTGEVERRPEILGIKQVVVVPIFLPISVT